VEGVPVAIGEGVVCEDALDADLVVGVEADRALEERRAARRFLVRQDLRVGQAAMVSTAEWTYS
jgi:hypothetical protein